MTTTSLRLRVLPGLKGDKGDQGAPGLGDMVAANNLSDLTDKPTARTNLGLGTAAVKDIGTSGDKVILANANNFFSRQQNVAGSVFSSAATTDSFPINNAGMGYLGTVNGATFFSVGPDASTVRAVRLVQFSSNASINRAVLVGNVDGTLTFPTYASASVLTTDASGNLVGSSTLAVARGGTGGGTASGTLLDNIAGFSSTGMLVRTGAGAYAFRTLTGMANEIAVSNGAGTAGNPTVSLPSALTFTGKTVTGGTFTGGAFNGSLGATTPSTALVTTLGASGLISASGGQIAFPATQVPSTDPNTLDDYEEGTWTPEIQFNGAAVGVTYSAQVGYYIKIGKLVTIWCKLTLSNKGSSTGVATIGGIPFASNTTYPAGTINGYHSGFTGLTGVVHSSLNAATTDRFSLLQTSATGSAVLMDTAFTNTTRIDFATSYVATA